MSQKIACSLLLALGLLSPPAQAQVTADGTVGTVVTPAGTDFTITGGTTSGTNLFHSFSQFSVPTGGAAIFNNDTNIANIFSRVTGGSASNIDGTIKAAGTATLFLLNPNGIIFGANSSLQIGGSFLATTADSIVFQDGYEFSATNPNTSPLLTVSVPVGLQMGANPGAIQVNGSGHQLIFDIPTFSFIRDNRPAGLQVPDGQTLALVGGDISLNGGNITAAGGRIELGSVTEPSTISLIPTADGFTFGYNGITNFGDIQLSQAASVEVSGEGGGNIQFQGRQISLVEDSIILADTLRAENGGLLSVRASESVELIGSQIPIFPTGLFNRVESGATGKGGNMTLDTPRLTISGTSLIQVNTLGVADGGDLTIHTDYLSLVDGGQIGVATSGAGNSGKLIVRASEEVEIRGSLGDFISSGLFTSVERSGTGNGGNLRIETNRLLVVEGGLVAAGTLAAGDGGNISIQATDVEVSEVLVNVGGGISGLGVNVGAPATGNGGSLVINADRLRVSNGGQVTASTLGAGNAGNITLNVDNLEVEGVSEDGQFASSITAFSQTDFAAGSANIVGDRVSVRDGAEINVSSQGLGDSGNLNITARNIFLDNGGSLRAEVNGGSQGNINLNVRDALLLRRGSSITANATGASTGGNININAGVIVGIPGENSDISANSDSSFGGRITINTNGIFGLKFSPQLTPLSDITASSGLGAAFSGTVNINQLVADPSSGLTELATALTDSSDQIESGCSASQGGQFIVTGRGGLPPNPNRRLQNDRAWSDIRDLSAFRGGTTEVAQQGDTPVLEVNSWRVNEVGNVELVAVVSNTEGATPSLNCDGTNTIISSTVEF